MAINFFTLSKHYLDRDAEKDFRQKALKARDIVALHLGDDYIYVEKRDLPLIQAHLKREGLPHTKWMIRNLAKFFWLNFLALNGYKKATQYLDNICPGLQWMKTPREDLIRDGIKTWQDVQSRWRAREEEIFCNGCSIRIKRIQHLDELAICQRHIERLQGSCRRLDTGKKGTFGFPQGGQKHQRNNQSPFVGGSTSGLGKKQKKIKKRR